MEKYLDLSKAKIELDEVRLCENHINQKMKIFETFFYLFITFLLLFACCFFASQSARSVLMFFVGLSALVIIPPVMIRDSRTKNYYIITDKKFVIYNSLRFYFTYDELRYVKVRKGITGLLFGCGSVKLGVVHTVHNVNTNRIIRRYNGSIYIRCINDYVEVARILNTLKTNFDKKREITTGLLHSKTIFQQLQYLFSFTLDVKKPDKNTYMHLFYDFHYLGRFVFQKKVLDTLERSATIDEKMYEKCSEIWQSFLSISEHHTKILYGEIDMTNDTISNSQYLQDFFKQYASIKKKLDQDGSI